MRETSEDTERIAIKIDHIVGLITNLTTIQRQLTVSAMDLQSLALAKKRQMKDSIDRAIEIGDIQEIYIKMLMKLTGRFINCFDDDEKQFG